MTWLEERYGDLTGWIFEHWLQPALYALGMMDYGEDIFGWLDFALFGVFGIAMAWAICRPLEAWRPVEPVTDRRAIRTDILYTLLARLGILPLLAFVFLASLQSAWEGWLTEAGLLPPTLEELVPALRSYPLLAFAAYVVVLDFAEYWRHRAQHGFRWWWALHAIHHAQRQMTFWTDDRTHVVDDVLAALWFGAVAESLSHANVRLHYGRIGERLLVSPRFHRLHHAPVSAGARGMNYAVLLPVWDWLFRTGDFRREEFPATGTPEEAEALATGGWLRQQWLGLRGMVGALAGR